MSSLVVSVRSLSCPPRGMCWRDLAASSPLSLEFVHTSPPCAVEARFSMQHHLYYGQITKNNEGFQQLGNAEVLFCEVLC